MGILKDHQNIIPSQCFKNSCTILPSRKWKHIIEMSLWFEVFLWEYLLSSTSIKINQQQEIEYKVNIFFGQKGSLKKWISDLAIKLFCFKSTTLNSHTNFLLFLHFYLHDLSTSIHFLWIRNLFCNNCNLYKWKSKKLCRSRGSNWEAVCLIVKGWVISLKFLL